MPVTERELPKLREIHKDRQIVFAIGTFDLFHDGHLEHLEWCSQLGDILVVAVNSDQRTKARKGSHRPVFSQATRLRVIDSLKVVDYTVLVEDARAAYEAPVKTAKLLRPNKIGLGSDQSAQYVEYWKKSFPDIEVAINPYPKFTSTTDTINNIRTLPIKE